MRKRTGKHISPIKWLLITASLVFLLLLAFFPFVLSDNKPILLKHKEEGILLPSQKNAYQLKSLNLEENTVWSIDPLFPYPADEVNMEEALLSPLSRSKHSGKIHILGTDSLGRDVLAGMIYGSRTAILVGFGACLLSLLIGVPLGIFSAFQIVGKKKIKLFRTLTILFSLFLAAWGLIWMIKTGDFPGIGLSVLLLVLPLLSIGFFLSSNINDRIRINIDSLIQSAADYFSSIPVLMILLVFLPLLSAKGLWAIIVIIGLMRWPVVNKYSRGEMISLLEKPWFKQLNHWGMPWKSTSLYYIFKAIQTPILTLAAFSISSAILAETTLSFLGLGMGPESVSWGDIIAQSREHPEAWWLIVFPGLAITVCVFLLNSLLAERIEKDYIREN